MQDRNRVQDWLLGGVGGLVLAFMMYSNDYAPFKAKDCNCACGRIPDGNIVPAPWNRPYKPNGSTGTVGEAK